MFAFIFHVTGVDSVPSPPRSHVFYSMSLHVLLAYYWCNQSLMDAWGGVTQGPADHQEYIKEETPSLNLCAPGP